MPDSTDITPASALDILQRLYILAAAAEIGQLDRREVACIAGQAADEIARLRCRIEELEMRLNNFGRAG